MKNDLTKNALSLLLSSSIMLGGGISVLADEQSSGGSDVIDVEEDTVSGEVMYGSASTEIAINSTNFPDKTFRELLMTSKYDSDENGYLSEEEIEYIKRLSVVDMDVSSLKGIEFLTNLCELYTYGTDLSSIDISANPGLQLAYQKGEETEWTDTTTEYSVYNESWVYPYRSILVDNSTMVTSYKDYGWKNNSKGWWFKNADGSYPKDCMKYIGGFLYCFDKDGYIITNTWKEIDGKWYRFNGSGEGCYGWNKINGKWYFFGVSQYMLTGTYVTIYDWDVSKGTHNITVYYVNEDGVMQTGWQFIKGEWRYFNKSGVMQTGWVNDSGKWYYFEDKSGGSDYTAAKMVTGWKQINGTWYYFKSSGAMAENEYCDGYWLSKGGAWSYKQRASWKKDSTGWWFGDATGWYAKNQTLTINGKSYNFNSAGYCTNP